MPKFLNIACGSTYIRSADWENVDYAPSDPAVKKANLLKNLKTSETKYDVIYCSHFIEHIPPEQLETFLLGCKALMRKDSLLRIVVPDSESLLREYLKHKDAGNKSFSEFAFVNFLDQCVRRQSGGLLEEYLAKIASGRLSELKEYGQDVCGSKAIDAHVQVALPASKASKLLSLIRRPTRAWITIEPYYIRLVCALLPQAFREQNVSFCSAGEKHLWMYDFDSLKSLLSQTGFSRIDRRTFDTSLRTDRLFAPLDEADGKPRKGNHQLFAEVQL